MQPTLATAQPNAIQLEMESLNPNNQEKNRNIQSNRFNRCLRTVDSGLGACKQWIINNPVPASLVGIGLLSGSILGLGLGLGLGLSGKTPTPTPTPTPIPTPITSIKNKIFFKFRGDSKRNVNIMECGNNKKLSECKSPNKCEITTSKNCIFLIEEKNISTEVKFNKENKENKEITWYGVITSLRTKNINKNKIPDNWNNQEVVKIEV